ncbi:murein biosynthesis integral membrane protein MurJ [Paraherbaspirillum soli]|uniref:Murein biosynthesis integral membrane protein MurJ n=1 Tax=Paraherbaspirillum soli TaxID=631222 RepID=A0ABW0M9Y7_9BURK
MKIVNTLSARIRTAQPEHHAIFTGMAWVSLFVIIGKLAGAAKEMAVAYRFGVGVEVDAYLFVLNFISWPIGVWFSVLTVVLVPLAAKMRQDAAGELPRFRAELFGVAIVLGLVLAILARLGLPMVLRSQWAGLPPATAALATHAAPTLAFLLPLGVLISLLSAWMLAAGRHANTLLEGVPAVVIGIAVLISAGSGIEPLVWATVGGFVAHVISLAIPLARRKEIEFPRFTWQSTQWTLFWRGFGIMLAGQALMSLIVIVDQFFAVHVGTGAFATLSYANRILALLLTLGGTVVSRATLPIFSKAHRQGNTQVRRVVTQWAGVMFLVGAVSSAVSWWLAPWVVKLLFERGAFTAQDSAAVSEVLRYALVQLPFYFAGLVLVSGLVSRGMHKLVALSAIANLVVKIFGNYLLVPAMGIKGIALATAFMYIVSFITLYKLTNITENHKGII